ncbi:DUF1338 domain-containing protein [bacterium]|nr:DUF1338 domain-containing protein [bacterium]
MQESTIDAILAGLMRRYRERVPNVGRILSLMVKAGIISHESAIENDHIAFRTMGVPKLGIQSLERIFINHGYTKMDPYDFVQKKLSAFWYSPPRPDMPRIFISELRVHELSPEAQRIINSYTDEVKSDPTLSLNLDDAAAVDEFLHRPLWRTPTWTDYQRLASESEYASWVIYNRYYLNHFTITIHNLPAGYNTIAQFNEFLEQNGIILNDAGGKIKISPDQKLIQSSTVAQTIDAEFAPTGDPSNLPFQPEIHSISGSYIEFAQREVLDEFKHLPPEKITRQHRKEGFERDNANSIFESTYSTQTRRKQS